MNLIKPENHLSPMSTASWVIHFWCALALGNNVPVVNVI